MPAIFNALPGLEVPVGAITKSLAKMWEDTSAKGGPAPAADDGKATQINLVIHLGYGTSVEDAVEQFQTAVRFSRRYPCRAVVLCPLASDNATEMRAKIYGECHLGKSKGDTRCCEFVMLSYPQAARKFLENQVSVCLFTDLPLYYWAHRFSSSAKLAEYQYLLSHSHRVIFDSSIVPVDALTFAWPKPEAVRDLVYARLLPVRQTIGQFLSAYAPEKLTTGLRAVKVAHADTLSAEARVLLGWVKERILGCGAKADVQFVTEPAKKSGRTLALSLEFADKKFFRWHGDFAQGSANLEADFSSGLTQLPAAVSLLSPEGSLGEAMFF